MHQEPTAPRVPPVLPADLEYLRPLGGKMGRVYLAREPELERLVAVKVLRPELSADETARLRFEREARSAASLMHAHVVPVYRFGWLPDGSPYLVMAYVRGRTLTDLLKAQGPMREAEALGLIGGLASALAAAHRKGIVHRDVRPDNVLVEEDSGSARLSNFGLARILEAGTSKSPQLTRTGQVLGEPHYAAPEQLRGEKVTEQADIYSLGILAYEVLTGEGPYRAETNAAWITAHLNADPIPISQLRTGVSPALETLLLRCLAPKPSHRPRAEGVVRTIDSVRVAGGDEQIGQGGEGLGVVRRRIPYIVGATFAAGLTLLGIVSQLVEMDLLRASIYPLTLNFALWGLVGSGVLAWFHGERGRQKMPPLEKWILAALVSGWIAVTVLLLIR